jgi:hypothetical protein
MGGVYSGLGVGLGSFVAGVLYTNFGSTVMFVSFICWLGVGFFVFAVSNFIFERKKGTNLSGRGSVVASGKYSGLINSIDEKDIVSVDHSAKPLLYDDRRDDVGYIQYGETPSRTDINSLTDTQKILLAQPPGGEGAI